MQLGGSTIADVFLPTNGRKSMQHFFACVLQPDLGLFSQGLCLGKGTKKLLCKRRSHSYFSSEREESLGTYNSPNRKCVSETRVGYRAGQKVRGRTISRSTFIFPTQLLERSYPYSICPPLSARTYALLVSACWWQGNSLLVNSCSLYKHMWPSLT